jgi:hypothetical protein
MTTLLRKEITSLVMDKKIKPVLTIDEASLLRLEVLAELHTLCQFEKDSKHFLPVDPGRTIQPGGQIDLPQFRTAWLHGWSPEATLKDSTWKECIVIWPTT